MPTIFSYRFAPLDPTFKDLQLQFFSWKIIYSWAVFKKTIWIWSCNVFKLSMIMIHEIISIIFSPIMIASAYLTIFALIFQTSYLYVDP